MEFFKQKPVVPLGHKTFLIGTLKHSLIQLFLIILFLFFMNSDLKDHELAIYALIGMLGAYLVIVIYFLDQWNIRGRFKDLYPEYELKYYVSFVCVWVPLISIPFHLLLCIKENSTNKIPPKIFYQPTKLFLIAIPIFAFQLSSLKIAYWLASPSSYVLLGIYKNAQTMMALDEQSRKMEIKESLYDHFLEKKIGRIHSQELIFLTQLTASDVIRKKEKEIIKGDLEKIENNVKYSIILLDETKKISNQIEKYKFKFSDFSLFHWINPSGFVEIIILTSMDMQMQKKLKNDLADTTAGLLQNMDNGMVKLPADIQAKYQPDILKIKKELKNSLL